MSLRLRLWLVGITWVALICPGKAAEVYSARNDLAGLGNVLLEHIQVFVVNFCDALGSESAKLSSAKKT
jgi:hypothetical protein